MYLTCMTVLSYKVLSNLIDLTATRLTQFGSHFLHSYFAPAWDARYCNERVCMSVCPLVRLTTTCSNFTKLPVHINYGRGSVLLRRQCNTLSLCASGFVDDVIFSHNEP